MQYVPVQLVTDPIKASELSKAILELNATFQRFGPLLDKRGTPYAQAIADEVFARALPHRSYRIDVKVLKGKGQVTLELFEPSETVT